MWFRKSDMVVAVLKEWSAVMVMVVIGIIVVAFFTINPSKELEASTSDDVLFRKSVEAQVDAAKALMDIAAQMRKLVDKVGGQDPVTCHGAKGPMEIECPKGCSAEQCIKLFSCERE